MKNFTKWIFSTHRVAGTIISLLFFMWFVTGLVLIYHPYPRVSESMLNVNRETLPTSLPNIKSVLGEDSLARLKSLSLCSQQQQTLALYKVGKRSVVVSADSEPVKPIDFVYIEQIASKWVNAPIKSVDTLRQRKQWVLFTKYDKMLPIYKFRFLDSEKHELFISGKSGEVVQFTDRTDRFWAWLGAIPHKLYFPFLRRHVDVWIQCFTVAGTICFLAALSGLIVGLFVSIKRYKLKHKFENPYKGVWRKWHYIFGLVFGIFTISWGLSGILAMQKIPQWMINTNGKYTFKSDDLWGEGLLPISDYKLNINDLQTRYRNIKEIEWLRFGDIPVYRVIDDSVEMYINASFNDSICELVLDKSIIYKQMAVLHGSVDSIAVELIDKYDNYYLAFRDNLPLPVYKVTVNDDVRSLYYINPATGDVRYLNKNKMARRWLFNGLHYLHFKSLLAHPWLWHSMIWLLCVGGAVVAGSGVCLGVLYIKRKIFR